VKATARNDNGSRLDSHRVATSGVHSDCRFNAGNAAIAYQQAIGVASRNH
jgi:hypothetical protein